MRIAYKTSGNKMANKGKKKKLLSNSLRNIHYVTNCSCSGCKNTPTSGIEINRIARSLQNDKNKEGGEIQKKNNMTQIRVLEKGEKNMFNGKGCRLLY